RGIGTCGPCAVLRGIGGELKCSGRIRGEGGGDLLNDRRRPGEPDLDVVRLRILDRGSDEPDQRHQNQETTDQWRKDRLGSCPIHTAVILQVWNYGVKVYADHDADGTAVSRALRNGIASEQGIWLATKAPAQLACRTAVGSSIPRKTPRVTAARKASPAPRPLTTSILTGGTSSP